MLFHKNSQKSHLIDNETELLLNKHGYMLSNDLLEDIQELIRIEKGMSSPDYSMEEHFSLREKITGICKKEFSELQSIQNKHFNRYKTRFITKWSDRVGLLAIKIVGVVAVVYWLIYAAIHLSTSSRQNTSTAQLWWSLFGMTIFIIVIIGTLSLLFIGVVLLIALFEHIKFKFRKEKTAFVSGNYVPETTSYRCTICGNITRKVKYSLFGNCTNRHRLYQNLLGFPKIYTWNLIRKNANHVPPATNKSSAVNN